MNYSSAVEGWNPGLVANPMLDSVVPGETIRLRDGRTLGFAQFGDPTGNAIFFFHGGGDSRLQRHADDSVAESLGIRLITTDRPGVGLSTYQRRRRLADWPSDIGQLADALSIPRFAVLGYSMGGPHALACAWGLPERVIVAGVVSGIAPFDRPGGMADMSPFVTRMFTYARRSPQFVRPSIFLMARRVRRDPQAFIDELFARATPYDRDVGSRPERRANHAQTLIEAARQGSRGLSWELSMMARPWGIPLADITVPVHLWYGADDTVTPLQMARYLVAAIPTAELELWPDAAHQAIFVYWREILAALAGSGDEATGG